MGQHVLALSTAPSVEKAAEIARALVDERLAACVNVVGGVRSIYRWQGTVHDDAEALCLIKTRRELVDRLRERLVALHPYEVPELIVVDLEGGHAPYLAWIDESVR
jgi:periplasmic divalent cation tolerance protein